MMNSNNNKNNETKINNESENKKSRNENQSETKTVNLRQTFKALKSKYRRACYLLKKIEENKLTGKVNDRDSTDEIECKKVVEEYERYLNTKRRRDEEDKGEQQIEDATNSNSPNSKRYKNDVTTSSLPVVSDDDPLLLAFVNEDLSKNKLVTDLWPEIECKLTPMIVDYVLNASENDPMPHYDSSKLFRGCRLIKCMDQFSKDLLLEYVAKISNSWEGVVVKLIPAHHIPRRPCARIWLPKMSKMNNNTLLKCLKLHNPSVPMDDWHVIRAETAKNNAMSYLLLISEESVAALNKADNKLRFGIRNAKVKILSSQSASTKKPDDIDNASSLLEDINLADI